MIVRIARTSRKYAAYGRYNGSLGVADSDCSDKESWEAFCDCRFPTDADNRLKCKSKPWACCPFGICPPWSSPANEYGASCRNIPHDNSGVGYTVGRIFSAVSLIDKVAVPMQMKSIAEKEAVDAQNAAAVAQNEVDIQHAADVQAAVSKYAKYGAWSLAAVAVAIVTVSIIIPKEPKP